MEVSVLTQNKIAELEHQAILEDPFWEQFSILGKETIKEVLEAKNWDQEEAWNELALRAATLTSDEDQNYKNHQLLLQMQGIFPAIPEEIIQETIKKNNGALDPVHQLEELNSIYTAKLLAAKYETTPERVIELLKAKKDERVVTTVLMKEQALKKVQPHLDKFPMLTEDDLLRAYFGNPHDETAWLAKLNEQKQKVILEQQKIAQEKAQQELKRKQEEEARLQRLAEEKARIEKENQIRLATLVAEKQEEERRRQEAEKKAFQEKQEKERKEREAALERERLENEKKEAERAEIKRKEAQIEAERLCAQTVAIECEENHREKQNAMREQISPRTVEPTALSQYPVQLTIDKDRVDSGGTISLKWSHSAEPTASDWVAIYKVGVDLDRARSYERGMWKNVTQRKDKGDKSSNRTGLISFTAHNSFGLHEIRYISPSNKKDRVYGRSSQFRIGPTFRLMKEIADKTQIKVSIQKLEGGEHSHAWVALYPPNKNSYSTYHYVTQDMTATFQDLQPGIYQVKLFSDSGYGSLAAELEIRIE